MQNNARLYLKQSRSLGHPAESIFRLICPKRNAEWMPGWGDITTMVYSESGHAEPGCVFQVASQPHLLGAASLICTKYQPFEVVEYTAMNPHFVYQILWSFIAKERDTHITMERTWTALDGEGQAYLEILRGDAPGQAPQLFDMLEYYLDTGKMLRR